jgi:hypothetical protein
MSALPPKADIVQHGGNVRFVPIADINSPASQGGEHPYSGKENFSTIKWSYRLSMLRGSLLARLLVVSNRVSVPGDGSTRAGGLEVALRPALQKNGGVWLGWSGACG